MVSPGRSDADLVVSARRGDNASFEELVLRFGPLVYSICLSVLHRPEDARDASQEAFLKAYRGLGELGDAGRFRGWIARIATSTALNARRTRNRRPALPLTTDVADERDAILEADERDAASEILGLLGELPGGYTTVLLLRFRADLPLSEIVQVTGLGLSNVKMRLQRGLAMLRAKMSGRERERPGSTGTKPAWNRVTRRHRSVSAMNEDRVDGAGDGDDAL